MKMKENNWKEIKKEDAIDKIKKELFIEAENFINKVKNAKLSLKEKLKYGIGQKMIKKILDQFGEDYFIGATTSRGLQKCEKTLNDGKTIEFESFIMKKDKGKYYIKNKK